jgi:hypothetical protein
MGEQMKDFNDAFDDWVDKWDKAVQDGVFKDAPKPPSTCTHTSKDSFFGPRQDDHTSDIKSSDSEYWRAIHSVADGVEMQRLDEADMGVSPLAGESPNPVRRETEGKDQELEPRPLGVTFDEEDVKSLESMKVKLHELERKVALMDGEKDYGSQVKAMIEKIDELSNKMCRPKN